MSRFHSSCICGCKNCKRSDNHIQILSTLTLSVLMMRPEKLYSRHCRQYEFGIRFHSCFYYKYFRVLTPLLYPQQCHAGLQVAHSLNYKAGNMTRTSWQHDADMEHTMRTDMGSGGVVIFSSYATCSWSRQFKIRQKQAVNLNLIYVLFEMSTQYRK